MKIALCSMINDGFLIAFEGFIKSLLKNNPWFDLDIILIDLKTSGKTKFKCLEYYPKINFIQPKYGNYRKVNFTRTQEILKCTYYKLDAFSYYDDYDRIIFIDLDTIVLKDISYLFNLECPLGGCKGYNRTRDVFRDDINSGVFVINKENLCKEIYFGLIRQARVGYSMPDQKTINLYFKGRITYLDKRYNCEKRMMVSKNFKDKFDDAYIIHYISQKPWDIQKDRNNQGFEAVEKIWWDYYRMKEEEWRTEWAEKNL